MLAAALLFVGVVSATYHSPAVRRQEATATATGVAFTAVTDCHFHGTTQFCLAEGTEYQVIGEATATVDQPSSYTGCHHHGADTYCFGEGSSEVQVIGAGEEAPAVTSAAGDGGSAASVTAVTGCHLHETSLFCMAGTTEYYIQTSVTATGDVPAQFTGCHSHGDELYCMTEDGGDVPVIPQEDIESGEASPDEQHCHFHAGVEHCVGAGESENESEGSCERVDRDYDIPIRIGMLFVVLVASSVGVFGPILMSTFMAVRTNIFLVILKQFGTGVIISTALVHLFTHASLMFGNHCLGDLGYEGTTAAIVTAGLFSSFLIEFLANRAMRWQASKKADSDVAILSPQAVAKAELTNITIMEMGIIFHSLLIGLTLVVAGDSYFVTLAIVIIFHQMFEGIALGTRIASLGHGLAAHLSQNHGHLHSHGTAVIPPIDRSEPSTVSLSKKLVLAAGFAIVTPIGMAIGIGVLDSFNGNDKSTIIAIGTLDAISAGILLWVGLVEMWAHDWMLGGELTDANWLTTALAMVGLLAGMILMSFLGKWA